jgi:Xaa-Pro aminopeptidase
LNEKLKVRQHLSGIVSNAKAGSHQVWDVVFEAQTQSIHQMRENLTAASVDIAARQVITEAGYGATFTHRVGHGIGIKGL